MDHPHLLAEQNVLYCGCRAAEVRAPNAELCPASQGFGVWTLGFSKAEPLRDARGSAAVQGCPPGSASLLAV